MDRKTPFRVALTSASALLLVGASLAQSHPVAPQLASNASARYTLYLDFSGFNYNGTWAGGTPGSVPAYNTDSDANTFSTTEQQAIKDTWARFANAYAGFNVNVTTIDPAARAGQASSDAVRQSYYDATQYVQHQILGGTNAWFSTGAGGVSYVGTTQNANTFSGGHTNWVFAESVYNTPKNLAAAGIHEDGHALGLGHQRDESNGGGYSDNNGAQGNGSYSPIMGTTYVSQRGTWRQGNTVAANSPAGVTNANDVAVIQSQGGMGAFLDDNIGHSLVTATSLAVNADGTVNVNSGNSKGFIMPKSSTGYSAGTGPNPNGDTTSYTSDFFAFNTAGGAVTLSANDGNSFLQTGVADPGATMRCVMNILNSAGIVVGTATEDSTTLVHTYSGTLGAGTYYAQIMSYGAYISAYEPNSRYFNMGGYFLTGSGFQAVPEPGTWAVLGLGALAAMRRRRRSA